VLNDVFSRVAVLPLVSKVLLAVASLVALGLLVVLGPVSVVLAGLVLVVAIFALVFRLLRRRPLRTWDLIALASLLLVVVFTGISNALYIGGQPSEQASSPQQGVLPSR